MPTPNGPYHPTANPLDDALERDGWAAVAGRLLADPSTSYWLVDAIQKLGRRDPVDALGDAEILHALQAARWLEIRHADEIAEQMPEATP